MKRIIIALCIVAAMLALAPQESQAGLFSRLFARRASVGSCSSCASCPSVAKGKPTLAPSRCYVDGNGNKVCPVQ